MEDTQKLEEVVVVGYGTQKKATLTGAIEQVSSKALESRAITNVGLALQGQTPGLVVTRTSPRPGNEELNFKIRGATSVNGGDPLIIVDGVPTVNTESFQNLNPDDVESISVLKDGAASIYGAKAANGVILVTTKRGKGGKINVDYSFNMRFTTPGITAFSPDMGQYATMWLEANKEEETPNWWAWVPSKLMPFQMSATTFISRRVVNFTFSSRPPSEVAATELRFPTVPKLAYHCPNGFFDGKKGTS